VVLVARYIYLWLWLLCEDNEIRRTRGENKATKLFNKYLKRMGVLPLIRFLILLI